MIRPADARLKASIMMSSSIRLSLTGRQVDCTTNTSEPRTDSPMFTEISPSEKCLTSLLPSGSPRLRAICAATLGVAFAAKILMSFP